MNVVFVAGGLNTRFEEYSIFPKILLPYKGNNSILMHNCELFKDDKKYLIISHLYYDMVQNYIKVNNLDVILIRSTNANGSFQTIKSVKEQLPKTDLLFIWSDLILNKKPVIVKYKHVICTYTGSYRYKAGRGTLIGCDINNGEQGNVPGIYYVKVFNPEESDEHVDLVDYIFENDFRVQNLQKDPEFSIVEFRDKGIYLDYVKNYVDDIQPRFFNQIKIDGNTFTKTTTDPKYTSLIQNEILWYKLVGEGVTPKLISNTENSLSIDYLGNYVTFANYCSTNTNEPEVIRKLVSKVKQLHEIPVEKEGDSIHMDTLVEFLYKANMRVDSIKPMLINFNEAEFVELLKKSYKYIEENNSKEYKFIHGDLNGSNILIDPITKDIKFIDPRGYYGKTSTYGLAEYDYAKLMYCFSGYDDFNNSIKYLYSNKGYDEPKKLPNHEYYDDYVKYDKIYTLMLGIIWICLSSYISNNIMKVNISYEHGINILKKFWEKNND